MISRLHRKQEDAKKMRANNFYPTSDPDFQKLKRYFDLIINSISVEIDSNKYLKLLALDGTMVVVGPPEKEMSICAFSLVNTRRNLAGSAISVIQEKQEMLISVIGITSHTIKIMPIQKVNEACERVVNSDVRYRFVIDVTN